MRAHTAFQRVARTVALGAALSVATPLVQAANAVEPLVDEAWVEQHLGSEEVVLLDLRVPGEDGYAGGHIPGAVSAHYPGAWRTKRDGVSGVMPSVDQLEAYLSDLGIGNEDTVVVVPAGTDATDFGAAARVYWTFKELGHDEVTIFNGGHGAWVAGNRQLETAIVDPEDDLFGAEPRAELLVDTPQISEKLGTDAVLVDARPADFFAGKQKHPDAPRYGRLPGAINLSHETFYDAATNRLKPVEELKQAVPSEVVAAQQKGFDIVSYCNTGHWAATDWFVLSELLGYDVALYDESMVGWTQDPNREVLSERTRFDDIKAWFSGLI